MIGRTGRTGARSGGPGRGSGRGAAGVAVLAASLVVASSPRPTAAHSALGDASGFVHWPDGTFTYHLSDGTSDALSNVTEGSDPAGAVEAAAAPWMADSSVVLQRGADRPESSVAADGVSLITFADTPANRAQVGGALAVTLLSVDLATLELQEADVVFSPAVTWSTDGTAGTHSVQDVATRELGRALGLMASGVIGASAYPFTAPHGDASAGATVARSLTGDDRGGVHALYPSDALAQATGTIVGRVTRGGSPLYGAHVVATRRSDGIVFGAGVSLGENQGESHGRFQIPALPPGDYVLHAEPLDGPVDHDDFVQPCGGTSRYGCPFETRFRTKFLGLNLRPTVVTVEAGAEVDVGDLAVPDVPPSLNAELLSVFVGGSSTVLDRYPVVIQPGEGRQLVFSGMGIEADVLDEVTCSDPAVAVLALTDVVLDTDGNVAVRVDVSVPSGAVPGPRSFLFRSGSEVSVLTGALDVAGAGGPEACFDDFDNDGDGLVDCDDTECAERIACLDDLCPDDPDKHDPGQCGCGEPDIDLDLDGTADCVDDCPLDPDKTEPGTCGCGSSDADLDGDGAPACEDACPLDPDKLEPGDCGCGVSDGDSDGDGLRDCDDGCPDDADKVDPGTCGCGIPEVDLDGDGFIDCGCQPGDLLRDGAAGLEDWMHGRRALILGQRGVTADDVTCGDLSPGSIAVGGDLGPHEWCPFGDEAFDLADLRVVRALAGAALVVDCTGGTDTVDPRPRRLPGDVAPRDDGGDDLVNVGDAILALRWTVQLDFPLTPEELLRADVAPRVQQGEALVVAGDGEVTIGDVVLILRASVRLDELVWPVREVAIRLDSSAAIAGFSATLTGWPPEAVPVGVTSTSCPDGDAGGLDVAGDTWAVTCASDPETVVGPVELARVAYRGPEAVAPTALGLEVALADSSLEPVPGQTSLATTP